MNNITNTKKVPVSSKTFEVMAKDDVLDALIHINPECKVVFVSDDGKHIASSERRRYNNMINIMIDGVCQKNVKTIEKQLNGHFWKQVQRF